MLTNVSVVDFIQLKMDCADLADAIFFFKITKAFDSVDHDVLLIVTLLCCGIQRHKLKWFSC